MDPANQTSSDVPTPSTSTAEETATTDTSQVQDEDQTNKQNPQEERYTWWQVEKITKACYHRGRKLYHVKWADEKGYEWVPEEYVAPVLKKEFHIHKTMQGRKKRRKKKTSVASRK